MHVYMKSYLSGVIPGFVIFGQHVSNVVKNHWKDLILVKELYFTFSWMDIHINNERIKAQIQIQKRFGGLGVYCIVQVFHGSFQWWTLNQPICNMWKYNGLGLDAQTSKISEYYLRLINSNNTVLRMS